MSSRIAGWPDQLPSRLDGLYDRVSELLGVAISPLGGDLTRLGTSELEWESAVIVAGADSAQLDSLVSLSEKLAASDAAHVRRIAFVVGDGWLGTDSSHVRLAAQSATALSLARSMAVRRSGGVRANVVCVPEPMFGVETELRGPLSHSVELVDVANAVGFFLGDDSGYINGQVLFVDCGRHLFSSMSA
jgi:hypothetical protein